MLSNKNCSYPLHVLHTIQVNALSQTIHGTKVFPNFQPSSVYTGELFGVEFLFSQSGISFCPKEEDLDVQIDEGFGEEVEESVEQLPSTDLEETTTISPLTDTESDEEEEV